MQSQRPHRNQTMSERNSTQHSWACVVCPVPLCKMAWGRRTVTLKERCTSAGLVREASQLLCSLFVRKQIYTSAKVCTSRLGMHSTKKGRVSPDNAEEASSEMQSNTGCECAPLCSIMLGCTGHCVEYLKVSPRWKWWNNMSMPLECFQSRGLL